MDVDLLADLRYEFRRIRMVDRSMVHLDDEQFFRRPAPHVNPVAVIVKHLAGNLTSRWIDFLATDGEKKSRDRDGEFLLTELDSRANLFIAWERGWKALFETIENLEFGYSLPRNMGNGIFFLKVVKVVYGA